MIILQVVAEICHHRVLFGVVSICFVSSVSSFRNTNTLWFTLLFVTRPLQLCIFFRENMIDACPHINFFPGTLFYWYGIYIYNIDIKTWKQFFLSQYVYCLLYKHAKHMYWEDFSLYMFLESKSIKPENSTCVLKMADLFSLCLNGRHKAYIYLCQRLNFELFSIYIYTPVYRFSPCFLIDQGNGMFTLSDMSSTLPRSDCPVDVCFLYNHSKVSLWNMTDICRCFLCLLLSLFQYVYKNQFVMLATYSLYFPFVLSASS